MRDLVLGTIENYGGMVSSSVSKRVDHLVVGGFGIAQLKRCGFGSKIDQALGLEPEGISLLVVNEVR